MRSATCARRTKSSTKLERWISTSIIWCMPPGPRARSWIGGRIPLSVDADINLLGFGVRAPRDVQESNVYDLALRTCAKLGCPPIDRSKIVADFGDVGEDRGSRRRPHADAIRLFAETEGVLLDPVYSGKAAAGLIDYCLTGAFKPGEKIVFLHRRRDEVSTDTSTRRATPDA